MAEAGTLVRELAEIPALVRRGLADEAAVAEAALAIAAARPAFALTIGRGSSDVVCEGLARLLGTELGLLTASLPPSLVTVDRARLRSGGALALVVSQSGMSPDILAAARAAREGGALLVGLVNAPGSPLAALCQHVIPVGAHPEVSVAATKSVILSWLAGAILIRSVAGQPLAPNATAVLAAALEQALDVGWDSSAARLARRNLVILARGAGLAPAKEMALKMRELAGLPAEAFSAAEFMHGPRAALDRDSALLTLDLPQGEAAEAASDAGLQPDFRIALVSAAGGPAAPSFVEGGLRLPLPAELPAVLHPLVATALAYPLAMALARARGRDPDDPADLRKVTLTV